MNRINMTRIILGAAILMICGCVHRQIVRKGEPTSQTTLTVARAGDAVQLRWKSEAGKSYSILYTEKLGGRSEWKILPGAVNLRGTGGDMNYTDLVETGRSRYYRLNISTESNSQIDR